MARLRRVNQDLPDLLTIRQFCALYQVSPATVKYWIKTGKITAMKIEQNWRIRNDYKTFESLPELKDKYPLREVDVAELLECTPRNVRYLCEAGKLLFKWHSTVRRFRVKDVHAFLQTYKRNGRANRFRPINWARKQLAALDAMQ